ncbi:vesicle transport protein USE1, putative [Ixodes scapularis]|uniref:Vesicle transport protein USE1 n=1 Tax=Ixodes scapularis TaxID=6945 RepID=B7Q881_IXOSC|nr:vesicle transport protein USE1, putative [Ixodes scapularis]|eukprot:XP_002412312.1 vesicle transport protein USE1, putative [Ixodes scapularis]
MAPVSRLEINFGRLLQRCEVLADDRNPTNWRFKKVGHVGVTYTSITIMNSCSQPSKDTLVQYSNKVEFLKRLIAQDKQGTTERTLRNEQLATLSPAPDQKAKEILLKRQSKVVQDVRDELFDSRTSNRPAGKENLPKTVTFEHFFFSHELLADWIILYSYGYPAKGTAGEDFDAVLRYHNSMQEKIAEEMVSLAQNLKQNALLAGHIVKKDTETVQKNVLATDQNYQRLQDEQNRLEEHIRRSCSCWIWLMLGIVCIVFLQMVVFMRIFPKRF